MLFLFLFVVILINSIYESKYDADSGNGINNRKNFTCIRLRGKVSKSDGCKCNKGEVEGIKPFPSLNVMINYCSKHQNDGCCEQQVSVFFIPAKGFYGVKKNHE